MESSRSLAWPIALVTRVELFLGQRDFLGTDVIVELSQIDQALQVGGERGAGFGLRRGFQRAAFCLGQLRSLLRSAFSRARD